MIIRALSIMVREHTALVGEGNDLLARIHPNTASNYNVKSSPARQEQSKDTAMTRQGQANTARNKQRQTRDTP